MKKFIDISPVDSRYFADAEGKTYLPIGCNLSFFRGSEDVPEETVLETYRTWMTNFAQNGGNFIRIWLGVPFFNVMPERVGEYDERAVSHIRYIVGLAEKLGLRIKFTLEHFRSIRKQNEAESFPGVVRFNNPVYIGMASDMHEYMNSPECRKAYLDKARFLAKCGFGDSPAVIAWELWNEINAVAPLEDYAPWSDYMIAELKQIFPKQMIVQNLGSFSGRDSYRNYDQLATVKDNGWMQVHRYFDPGAELDVCRGPMDILCADAVRELLDRSPARPAILAECGAVEKNHSRYSDQYADDREGLLLHDMIFAAFFAGSAGCGQPWHWDHIYIAGHNLWYHFKRFAKAVEGLDPAAEHFRPFRTESHRMRIYGLRGMETVLLWLRTKDGGTAENESFRFGGRGTAEIYFPLEDRREALKVEENAWCNLPAVKRSAVIRFVR